MKQLKRNNKIEKLYQLLKRKHNSPNAQWSLWCKRKKTEREREEVVIGAILTQRTNWKNVERAIDNLKKEGVDSLNKIAHLKIRKLQEIIKPAGFYKTKSRYLLNLARFIVKKYGNIKRLKKEKTKELRQELLRLRGIGEETADSILLYALDKPVFVVDEYTRRLIKREGICRKTSYSFLQNLFEKSLRKDFRLYQDFHALIVTDGKSEK